MWFLLIFWVFSRKDNAEYLARNTTFFSISDRSVCLVFKINIIKMEVRLD